MYETEDGFDTHIEKAFLCHFFCRYLIDKKSVRFAVFFVQSYNYLSPEDANLVGETYVERFLFIYLFGVLCNIVSLQYTKGSIIHLFFKRYSIPPLYAFKLQQISIKHMSYVTANAVLYWVVRLRRDERLYVRALVN